jgi:hypothetical protein
MPANLTDLPLKRALIVGLWPASASSLKRVCQAIPVVPNVPRAVSEISTFDWLGIIDPIVSGR